MKKKLFSDMPIGLYQQQVASELHKQVMRMSESELVDAESGKLAKGRQFVPLAIDWDSLVALGQHERVSRAHDSFFDEEQDVVEAIYSFEVPYRGSRSLLDLQPSNSKRIALEPGVNDHSIIFEIVGADKPQLERIKDFLNQNVAALNSELGAFNQTVETAIKQAVEARKEQLKKNDEGLAAFGVPLKED